MRRCTRRHFDALAALGARAGAVWQRQHASGFPSPSGCNALYSQRIGVETMDTQAACRTYNFLAGEGRKVVAALLV